MAMKLVWLLIFVLAVFGETRHVHPRSEQATDLTQERVINVNNYDTAKTEVLKPMKPFPQTSIMFFKSYDPCENGFKLDFQGICREVWF